LAELLEAIDVPGSGPVPALLVGGPAPDGGVVELAGRGTQPVQLDVVARLDAFPGMSQSGPTVVLALDRLTAIGVPYTESVWVRGDPAPVVERLTSAGIDVRSVRRPDQALDTATFLAVVWTFGFVRALAVLGGTVSAVGLLVYLDARQRSRQLAYGLSRHMGLSRSTHRRSIGLELVVMVVPATACGVLAGIAVSTVFVPRLDPLPRFEPGTDAVVARPVVAAAVAVAGVLCLVGAQIGQRAADRVRLSAALRHGG
jgi:putative ABC transport system permease protein